MNTPHRTTVSCVIFCLCALLSTLPLLGLHAAHKTVRYEGVTLPSRVHRMAPPIDEIVQEVLVRPGDVVQAGDPLVRLRDGEARLQLDLLTLRTESTLSIDAAKATWELSVVEEEDRREAMGDGAVLEPEMRRAILKTKRDRLLYEKALQDQQEVALQRDRARETLERYTVRAPANAVVIAVNVEAGELPQRGTALVELVDTSSLRVEFGVPVEQAMRMNTGDPAAILLRIPGSSDTVLRGTITFVSPLVDITAGPRKERGRRLVHVEAPNPDGYPAGTIAEVLFTETAIGAD